MPPRPTPSGGRSPQGVGPSHPGLLALAAALGRQAAREDHAARKAAAAEQVDNPPRSSDR